MAQFKIHGMIQLQQEIAKISEMDNGEIAKKMLKEGSKDVANEWFRQSETLHDRHTGNMKRAIDTTRVRKNSYGRFTITYPMEYEERWRRGRVIKMRHAAKAFYQHYGWTNNLTGRFVSGDRWVDKVDMKAEPVAEATMQKIWDEFLRKNSK